MSRMRIQHYLLVVAMLTCGWWPQPTWAGDKNLLTFIVQVGKQVVSSREVEFERLYRATAAESSGAPVTAPDSLDDTAILNSLVIRTLWETILDRAAWPAAPTDVVEDLIAPLKNAWEHSDLEYPRELLPWTRAQIVLQVRQNRYVEERLSRDRRRGESIPMRQLRELSTVAAGEELQILDPDWIQVYAPGFSFNAILGIGRANQKN